MKEKAMDTGLVVGTCYLIRTVTHYYTGRLVAVHPQELVLEDAAWVQDTGRYAACLAEGTLPRVEIVPPGPLVINRGGVIDAAVWSHPLPRKTI